MGTVTYSKLILRERRMMARLQDALGKRSLQNAVTGIAVLCLGAAGFAAPIVSKAPAFSLQSSSANHSYAALGTGAALQLDHAIPGEDEDCVRVVRIVGPHGQVYVTRGLICQE